MNGNGAVRSWRISIAQGSTFDCVETDTLVDGAERAGWNLPASCRAGICGSCESEVREGSYVLRGRNGDGAAIDAPSRGVKLCSARPRSDMTIVAPQARPVDPQSRKLLNAKVLQIERVASEVAVLKLRFPAGIRAKFRAGQYLKVVWDDGHERCFSMANAPQNNDGVELHVRQVEGGRFSGAVFERLRPGDVVQLRMPLGDFHLREGARPIVFVAGGTGFAPVQSMINDLQRRGIVRPIRLYVGGRTPELLYRDALIRQWVEGCPDFVYIPVVSSPTPEDGWRGRTGLVHEAVIEDLPSLAGREVYACGAPGMVAAAREAFGNHGLAAGDFHCDAFVPAQHGGS